MKIIDVQQGSVEWGMARAGIPTASEFDNLVTPEFKVRTGEMPRTYLAKKLAEKWQGAPLVTNNTFDMDVGTILEGEAIPWFELETGLPVQRVGFITTDDGRIGCSPDGLVGLMLGDGGIEVKCPRIETHVKYLMSGDLPKEYAHQVHGSMFVTGCDSWRFLSYRRHLPPLLLNIKRDERIQESLRLALDMFLEQFDVEWMKLCDKNGGPPKRFTQPQPKPEFVSEFPS